VAGAWSLGNSDWITLVAAVLGILATWVYGGALDKNRLKHLGASLP
jgi:hypothetical protein